MTLPVERQLRTHERPGGTVADRRLSETPVAASWPLVPRCAVISGRRWLRDVSAAGWFRDRLHPFGSDVGSLVPEGFEAYARVFHPVVVPGASPRRWSEVAAANGRHAHPQMQLHTISRPDDAASPEFYERGPGFDAGSLPAVERHVLVELLRPATSSPQRCWFGVWEGFGGLDDQGVRERVVVPNRAYLLASGPVERALDPFHDPDQSANLWWPDDHAWFVATEIDLAWTYVGASAAVVADLVADPRVEAMEAQIGDRFSYDSDNLN